MKMSGFLIIMGRKEGPMDPPRLVVDDGRGWGAVRLGGREKEPKTLGPEETMSLQRAGTETFERASKAEKFVSSSRYGREMERRG